MPERTSTQDATWLLRADRHLALPDSEPHSLLTVLGSLWDGKSASNPKVTNEDSANYPESLWNLDCVFSKDEKLVKKNCRQVTQSLAN